MGLRRKIACLIALCVSGSVLLGGCGDSVPQKDAALHVVCTIFPEYDWLRQLTAGADGVELTLLIQNGTDLHSYQPSVKDIAAISTADVFCHVGGTSDTWGNDALETTGNQTAKLVSMAEVADADAEVLAEGMQDEEHHHHEHEQEGTSEEELDEHVWLSLRRAELVCNAMCDALCEVDPTQAEIYTKNCAAYVAQLRALDAKYAEMTENAARDTVLVADRFPFRYLAEDYGLTYYAAFPGCAAESEASFETIAFLSDKVRSLTLPCVLVTESSDQSLAKTILESADTDSEILTLQSMQAVSQAQIQAGATYLSEMEKNYDVLEQALN